MKTNKMKTSGRVNFSYDGYSTVTRLKDKTLKGMFNEAQRIIAKNGKVGVQRITLPLHSLIYGCKGTAFSVEKIIIKKISHLNNKQL